MCRFCHCVYKDLEVKIHDFTEHGSHEIWTREEYDQIIKKLPDNAEEEEPLELSYHNESLDIDFNRTEEETEDEDSVSPDEGSEASDDESEVFEKRGVRSECPLNTLASFHCIDQFPVDVLHDVFEGQC